ncbi:MAG: hypothetical protein R3D33_05920 [Hyphomicrobiaceae bacterium]
MADPRHPPLLTQDIPALPRFDDGPEVQSKKPVFGKRGVAEAEPATPPASVAASRTRH